MGLAILMAGIVMLIYETKNITVQQSDGSDDTDDVSMSRETMPTMTVAPSEEMENLLHTAPGSDGDVAW
jgi:hypothetical protein